MNRIISTTHEIEASQTTLAIGTIQSTLSPSSLEEKHMFQIFFAKNMSCNINAHMHKSFESLPLRLSIVSNWAYFLRWTHRDLKLIWSHFVVDSLPESQNDIFYISAQNLEVLDFQPWFSYYLLFSAKFLHMQVLLSNLCLFLRHRLVCTFNT